jgi:hypothetical protein
MTIDELREAAQRRPFRPFEIRTADGRVGTVAHPENVAWDEDSRTAVCRIGRGWDVIDVDLITSLGLMATPRPKRSRGA